MGATMPVAPERHLIKKYANRKLYDTRTSSYVTLDDLSSMVKEGGEFNQLVARVEKVEVENLLPCHNLLDGI